MTRPRSYRNDRVWDKYVDGSPVYPTLRTLRNMSPVSELLSLRSTGVYRDLFTDE